MGKTARATSLASPLPMLLCQMVCRLPALCTLTIVRCSLALAVLAWPSPGTSTRGPGAPCPLFMWLSYQSCTTELQPQLLTTGTRSPKKLAGSCPYITGLHAALPQEGWSRGLGELELPNCTEKVTLNMPLWDPWGLLHWCWATDRHSRVLSPLVRLYTREKGPRK